MKQYRVFITEEAKTDIEQLSDVIKHKYKSPQTAFNYIQGLVNEINKLEVSAESYTVQTRKSFLKYSYNVRRINYKKMSIIYTVSNYTVYIHRIIPSSAIYDI